MSRNATWLGDDDGNMKRMRPRSDKLRLSSNHRRAEVVCGDAGDRPMVLAIVFPRVALDRLRVLSQMTSVDLGCDLDLWCRCGREHHVDGARLRAEVQANPVRRGRAPMIDVGRVEAGTGITRPLD